MRKPTPQQILRAKRRSSTRLYWDIGYAYFLYTSPKWKRRRPEILYLQPKLEYRTGTVSKRKIIQDGKRESKKINSKLRRIICVRLRWCEKSERLEGSKNAAQWGIILSPAVLAQIPEWAFTAAAVPAVLGSFLKIHGHLDKFCKCKKKRK